MAHTALFLSFSCLYSFKVSSSDFSFPSDFFDSFLRINTLFVVLLFRNLSAATLIRICCFDSSVYLRHCYLPFSYCSLKSCSVFHLQLLLLQQLQRILYAFVLDRSLARCRSFVHLFSLFLRSPLCFLSRLLLFRYLLLSCLLLFVSLSLFCLQRITSTGLVGWHRTFISFSRVSALSTRRLTSFWSRSPSPSLARSSSTSIRSPIPLFTLPSPSA